MLGKAIASISKEGAVAQLGEHLPCTQGVSGSIPLSSTNLRVGEDVKRHKVSFDLKEAG